MTSDKSPPSKVLNAVFEGGGVRGIAHVGALHRMEEKGYSFSQVAGTSAGAIVAGLYAAGYSSKEMKSILMDKDFSSFLSSPISKLFNIIRSYGIHDADGLYLWLRQCLKDKEVFKFKDLPRHLTIRVTNVTERSYWDISNETDPNMDVAEAITMSASIPFFFRPRIFGSKVLVDGGVLSNYPLSIFSDSPAPTIGFKLISDDKHPLQSKPSNLVSFVLALIDTMRRAHDKHQAENRYSGMTIHIDCGSISATDFALTNEQKEQLFLSGKEAATAFLDSSESMLRARIPPGHLGLVEIKLSNALVETLKELSEEEDHQSILRIGPAISRILYLEGMLQARLDIGRIVENAAMMADEPGKRAQALIDDIGWSLVTRQERDLGESKILEGIALAQKSEEFYWAAKGFRHLAGIAIQKHNLEDARKHLEASLLEANKIPHLREKNEMIAGIMYGQAEVEIRSGNYDLAERKINETDQMYQKLGDQDRRVKIFSQRAKIASARGKWSLARDYYREGIRECKKLNRTDELIRNYDGLASIATHEGDQKTANDYKRKADNLRNQLPLPF